MSCFWDVDSDRKKNKTNSGVLSHQRTGCKGHHFNILNQTLPIKKMQWAPRMRTFNFWLPSTSTLISWCPLSTKVYVGGSKQSGKPDRNTEVQCCSISYKQSCITPNCFMYSKHGFTTTPLTQTPKEKKMV